jgi:hypothetical protein
MIQDSVIISSSPSLAGKLGLYIEKHNNFKKRITGMAEKKCKELSREKVGWLKW